MFPYFNFAYKVKFNDATAKGPANKQTNFTQQQTRRAKRIHCLHLDTIQSTCKQRKSHKKSTPPKRNTLC